MPTEITFPDPSGYTETPWTDPNGKQWIADSKGRWSAYKADTGGGSGAWDDITGKPAAITGTTASFTTALESKLAGIEAGATGDQDLSGLLTISTAASTYAPISTTVTLAGTQTLTNKSISAGQITGLGALATSTDAANLTGNIARARIDNALSANAAPIVATTVTASGAVSGASLTIGGNSQQNVATTASPTFVIANATTGFYGTDARLVTSSGGVMLLGPTFYLTWGNSSPTSTKDTSLSRISGGVLGVGTGAAGSTAGSLSLTNLTASGTVTAAQYLYTTALFVTESTTARTLTSSDHGKTIVCTNSSAVAITLNTGLPTCFFVTIIQKGAGQVTVSGSATLEVFTGFAAKTAGQHAQMSVSNYGTSNVYHVAGQLGI